MAGRRSCTSSSRTAVDHVHMDVVGIAIAVVSFTILLGLIYALDRI
jgi:hypothetical protein